MQTPQRSETARAAGHPAVAAAFIYAGLSVAGAAAFLLVTTFTGDYPAVARWGGAAWIFLLLMIVLMPIVIPRVQKHGRGKGTPPGVLPFDAETANSVDIAERVAPGKPDEPAECPIEEPESRE